MKNSNKKKKIIGAIAIMLILIILTIIITTNVVKNNGLNNGQYLATANGNSGRTYINITGYSGNTITYYWATNSVNLSVNVPYAYIE